jgi:UDP-N-acetylmuramyl pentapeptide phosphotransferase/UDP-N-acetylglucosamine-1-phosphate transferase
MVIYLACFFSSFILTILLVKYSHLHEHLSHDTDLSGPQKFHKQPVARIGGVSIFTGITVGIIAYTSRNHDYATSFYLFTFSGIAFFTGLLEDITKKIAPLSRLIFIAIASYLAIEFLNLPIKQVSIFGIDFLLQFSIISLIFTIIAITGLSHAYNIIDGFNGLASMVAILTLTSIAYVGFKHNDHLIVFFSLCMTASILGFFLFNYPNGLIFLGDGGAYLLGFWIAILSLLLVSRHATISPWYALLVNGYPIMETLFTIYRRTSQRKKRVGLPDGIHFHTIIYRRILNPESRRLKFSLSANSNTSPYLWLLSGLAIIPATVFSHTTLLLIPLTIIFILLYVWLYKKVVTFKTPKWLHLLGF